MLRLHKLVYYKFVIVYCISIYNKIIFYSIIPFTDFIHLNCTDLPQQWGKVSNKGKECKNHYQYLNYAIIMNEMNPIIINVYQIIYQEMLDMKFFH